MVAVVLAGAAAIAMPAAPAGATTTILTGSVSASGTQFVGKTFTVDTAGQVNISTDWDDPTANLNVFLYDPTNAVVASSTSLTAKPEVLSYNATLLGTYRLGVKAFSGSANFTATVNTPTATTGTVSGRMWDDLNGNGVQDAGESSGPSGLTVTLLDSGGATKATTTTATGGTYSFSAVPIGSYRVALTVPSGYTLSPQGQGGNPAADSDLDPTTGQSALVAVNANATTTVDGGVASRPVSVQQTWTGAVDSAGSNWAQTNFTTSASGPINISVDWNNVGANLNIFLYSGATVVASSTSTTAKPETLTYNGAAGTYKLGVKAVSGGAASFTATITSPVTPTTVAGTVWQDSNGDGIRNEAGRVGGVTVDLRQGGSTLQSTVTAADGTYRFPLLVPGSYSVLVHLSAGYSFSPQAQGSDPTVDSDVDATGASATVNATAGATVYLDAGFAPSQTELGPFSGTVSSSGTSWLQYFVTPPATGVLTLTLSWPAGPDLNLYAYNPANTAVGIATSTTANPETFQMYVTGGAQYRLGVKAVSGGSASFTLSAQWGPAGAPASPPVAAAYASTIGNAGHAEMYPSGFDVGPDGTVYAADTGNDHVKAYNPNGTLKWDVGTVSVRQNGSFGNPRDLAYYNGSVYVADTVFNRVQVLDAATGAYQSQWTGFGTILGISAGVDASSQPVILVTEDANARTRVFTPTGTFIRNIGGVTGSGNGQLKLPRDAATDSAGNIYIADYGNSRIAKFSPTGTWIANFGSFGTGPGQMRSPYGVAIDPLTNTVYVADANNNRIDVFDSSGTFLRMFAGPGTGNGQFSDMRRVALGAGPNPDVYGADFWGYRIEQFHNDGTFVMNFGNVPPPTQGFNEPAGITSDGSALFVADTTNQRVERYGFDGSWQQTWGTRGFGVGNPGVNWPTDLTILPSGTIYLADTRNSRVTEFDRNGVPTGREFGSVGSAIGQLNWPGGIDAAGTMFVVADTQNNRVQLWDPNNASTPVQWSTGGFNNPGDVAVWNNRVYVADSGNRRIVVLSLTDGSVIKIVPNGAITGATGLAVDPNGYIWVVDGNQSRVLEIMDTGVILQSFGTWGTGTNNFAAPTRAFIVTTGGVSTLYVADQDNDRVQAIRIS